MNDYRVHVGDKVTVKFTFEVDGIRKNNHKDGVLTLNGWIRDSEGKVVELVSIPDVCLIDFNPNQHPRTL